VADYWFYEQDGNTFGPISAEELAALVFSEALRPTDRIWPQGYGPEAAVLVSAAFSSDQSPPSAPAAGPIPDWLADVEKVEQAEPPLVEEAQVPDWVADVANPPPAKPVAPNPPLAKPVAPKKSAPSLFDYVRQTKGPPKPPAKTPPKPPPPA
jgi:hypothetical protein